VLSESKQRQKNFLPISRAQHGATRGSALCQKALESFGASRTRGTRFSSRRLVIFQPLSPVCALMRC
jgi:hypothetical protein